MPSPLSAEIISALIPDVNPLNIAPGTANVPAGQVIAGACKTLGCNLTNSILALILMPPGLTIAPSLKIFLPNRSISF